MVTRKRPPPGGITARPRRPSPDEARLLTVYHDAEHYLIRSVAEEVAGVADVADAHGPEADETDRARVEGMQRVRQAADRAVRGLDAKAAERVEKIVATAAETGVDEAVRQLNEVTSVPGGLADYADTINRGALDRLAATAVSSLREAHLSILRTTPDAFEWATRRTVTAVLTGAETRREASQRALWALLRRGVTHFRDRTGRRWRLSSYVEMATRTAAARAHVDAQLDRLSAAGHDLVQVSDAPRECPKCRPWEGKVLVNGRGFEPGDEIEAEHAIEDGKMLRVKIAGTVEHARRSGLLHPNCRHSLSIYLPGVTQPMNARSEPKKYRAGQRQREIERNIRAWKERESAAVTDADRADAKAGVRRWQAKMTEHLDRHPDLKRLRYREAPGAGNVPSKARMEKLGQPVPDEVEGHLT